MDNIDKRKGGDTMLKLTEEQLDVIVESAVKKILSEMAFRRKDFVDHIVGELTQIFENWCLVRYCVLTGRTRHKKHWSDELYTHIVNIQGYSLKDNNTYDYKHKAIMDCFDRYDFFDPNVIDGRISLKFRREGISRKDRLYSEIVDDCIRNHTKLIGVLANSVNTSSVEDFISDLLGENYTELQ